MSAVGAIETPPLAGVGDEAGRTLAQQVAVHREIGWRRIELRTIAGRRVAECDRATLARVVSRLESAGLTPTAIASPIGGWSRPITCPFGPELEELERTLHVAERLGVRHVRVMSYPNDGLPEASWRAAAARRLAALGRRAEQAGVELLLENCIGYGARDGTSMLQLLADAGSPALHVLFDTGNPVYYGYDGHEYLRRVAPHVRHVHVKDARRTAAGVEFVAPGAGDADVAGLLSVMIDGGYRGCLAVEPEIARAARAGTDTPPQLLRQTFLACGRALERLLHGVVCSRSSRSRA